MKFLFCFYFFLMERIYDIRDSQGVLSCFPIGQKVMVGVYFGMSDSIMGVKWQN
jgi:hypothetical protein